SPIVAKISGEAMRIAATQNEAVNRISKASITNAPPPPCCAWSPSPVNGGGSRCGSPRRWFLPRGAGEEDRRRWWRGQSRKRYSSSLPPPDAEAREHDRHDHGQKRGRDHDFGDVGGNARRSAHRV